MTRNSYKNNQFDFDIQQTCSTTECTGLIASSPQTEDEWENYMDVYGFGMPKADQRKLED